MCGIVGYLGQKDSLPILLEALRRLEYRGYDSAGVAVLEESHLVIRKRAGKLGQLEHLVDDGGELQEDHRRVPERSLCGRGRDRRLHRQGTVGQ